MIGLKAILIGSVIALWIEAIRIIRRAWRQRRCLHLHPELVEVDGSVRRVRCLDCGFDGLEAIG